MVDKGYIYIRRHESYDVYNVCKLGKASNIPDRDSQYATGELKRGYFAYVYELEKIQMSIVERLLQNNFQELNVILNGGTEFYKLDIINLIESYFIDIGIKYKKLSNEEINSLIRFSRIKNTLKNIDIQEFIKQIKKKDIKYKPRDDQIEIINKSIKYFEENNKGLLVLMCGVGKTLISLWITESLSMKKVLIGVPNKLLLKQWEEKVKIIFQDRPFLIIFGGIDNEVIKGFLKKNDKECIIISTYSSSHKLFNVSKELEYKFDMKINDECHHLTSNDMSISNNSKSFIQIMNIESKKQLSLTATLKNLEGNSDEIISNDNEKYFGKIIDRKCLLWAINRDIVCDYFIQTIITDEEKLENELRRFKIEDENDKRLFLSSYASLKSICEGHSHHLLIYSNNKDNSLKLIEYIKILIEDNYFGIKNLYYSNYHSEMKYIDQKEILNNFDKSKYGIITCVYCLGEGWDCPLLDGVVFAENMTSNIRIVQSALRASRKNNDDINKKTKIILPILNRDDWLENNDNNDLKKVREIIYQMALEDETIMQKIKVFKINIEKYNSISHEGNREILEEYGDYDDELTKKLRLKTLKRTALGVTYEKAMKLIAEKNIKSKEEYFRLCEKDNRLNVDPEIIFKGKFTNWLEYLGIERIYYDYETCKKKVNEYVIENNINFEYVDIARKLKSTDDNFPPIDLWTEYYEINDLSEMININKSKILVEF